MSEPSEEFHWFGAEAEVVIRGQRAVAVYPNPWGAVVIRAERTWDEEADTCIIIDKAHARAVAEAILAAAEFEPDAEADMPRPRVDKTAAERQRRYRERQRELELAGDMAQAAE
jgi:hypothetical protein